MESDKENKKFVVSVTKSGEKFVPAYDSGLSKPEGCLSRKKKKDLATRVTKYMILLCSCSPLGQ